jgi:hypothetical protein
MLGRISQESLGYLLVSLFFAVPGFSADATSKIPSEIEFQQRIQQESFAAERLSFWQQRLNLQDWKVSITVCRSSDLRRQTVGNVHWDPKKKTAVIRVLDASDYEIGFPAVLRDVEITVVHELVHLELAYLPRNESSADPEEQAVNRITDALLKLHRNE